MQSGLSRVLNRVRQPEYTGENRCLPCTTVNVAIAVILSAGLAFIRPLLGVTTLVVSLVAIYTRGYLVPGTPALTKRYFPDWLLAKFDKGPADSEESFGVNADVFDMTDDQRAVGSRGEANE